MTFNLDQFAMFNQADPAAQEAQVAMAKAIMDRLSSRRSNVVKGSVPVDGCAKRRFRRLRQEGDDVDLAIHRGHLYGSMAHGPRGTAAVKNGTYDVITAAFNGEYADGAAAASALAVAVAAAQ